MCVCGPCVHRNVLRAVLKEHSLDVNAACIVCFYCEFESFFVVFLLFMLDVVQDVGGVEEFFSIGRNVCAHGRGISFTSDADTRLFDTAAMLRLPPSSPLEAKLLAILAVLCFNTPVAVQLCSGDLHLLPALAKEFLFWSAEPHVAKVSTQTCARTRTHTISLSQDTHTRTQSLSRKTHTLITRHHARTHTRTAFKRICTLKIILISMCLQLAS